MDLQFKETALAKWRKYFPTAMLPVGAFYSDSCNGAMSVKTPASNKRGYTCIFAQMAPLFKGEPLCYEASTIGCWGGLSAIFGGEYNAEATTKLLCEVERFKRDAALAQELHDINPVAEPTGRYFVLKPFDRLTEADEPVLFFVFEKPDVISALHTLAGFDDPRPDSVIVPFGSGCEQVFGFACKEEKNDNPKAIIGGLDVAMRGCVKEGYLSFSMPTKRFIRMIENMDASFLDTYIWHNLRRRVEKENRSPD